LELSGAEIPPELTELWNSYKSQQESEGKKVKGGGGFSGKGYKFDDSEAQLATEMRKFQKHALGMEQFKKKLISVSMNMQFTLFFSGNVEGLQDSDDEDIEGDIEQQIETLMAPKKIVKDVIVTPTTQQPTPTSTVPASEKLKLAKQLAMNLPSIKNMGSDSKVQQTAEAVIRGGVVSNVQPKVTAKNVAEQLAAKLNTRLNYQPTDEQASGGSVRTAQIFSFADIFLHSFQSNKAYDNFVIFQDATPFTIESTNPPVQKKYEEELEINDFPQQARWRITSKETLAQIGEYSEAGITVRGTFVQPGKTAPEGERKLYLAIESMSELAVSKAVSEIRRILKEEMLRIQTSAHHLMGNKSRYKVV
jgi:ATP-dependent RNA helicase DDX46/PRP5